MKRHSLADVLEGIVFGTQLCTTVAFALMYMAHLIEAGHILNDNWHFMVYVNVITAMVFLFVPYMRPRNDEYQVRLAIDTEINNDLDWLENKAKHY